MADWFPEAIRDEGNDAGDYTDLGEPKGLLHTTEGQSYAGARQAYVINNSWPHATCTYEDDRFVIYQHVPLSKPSRALKNKSGGVETNRDNVIQLEIVGTADRHNAASWGDQYVENFPQPYLDGIARWMRFVNQNKGVPNRCSVIFKKYPESYGNNGVRLTNAQWDAYTGWLGHQHAAENDHGDPGLIDMAYLLAEAAGTPQPEPIPEEEDVRYPFIVTNSRSQSLLVLSPEGTIGMNSTDKTAYVAAGTDDVRLTDDGFARFQRLPRLDT